MGNRARPRAGHSADDPLPTGARPVGEPVRPGRAERRRLARKVKRRRRRSAVREIPLLVGAALLIALVLKTFLVQAFVIPSGSMEQTIRIGDRVLVDKLTPWFGAEPQRGDVVVFQDPGGWLPPEEQDRAEDPAGVKQVKTALTFVGLLPSADERDLIKRVVGVGGDTVRCCGQDGRITVNGVPLDEPYLHPGNRPSEQPFEVKVPAGRLFVLGDHRSDSADSRFHLETLGGTVAESGVVGRARWIAWPLDHWSTLEERGTYASVPDAQAGSTAARDASNSVTPQDRYGTIPLPASAELPLAMGVVGVGRVRPLRQRWYSDGKEWMWGTWRSARDPAARNRRGGPTGSPGHR